VPSPDDDRFLVCADYRRNRPGEKQESHWKGNEFCVTAPIPGPPSRGSCDTAAQHLAPSRPLAPMPRMPSGPIRQTQTAPP